MGFNGTATVTPAGKPARLSSTGSLNTGWRRNRPLRATVCPGLSVSAGVRKSTANGLFTFTEMAGTGAVLSTLLILLLPCRSKSTVASEALSGGVIVRETALALAAAVAGLIGNELGGGGWPGANGGIRAVTSTAAGLFVSVTGTAAG